MTWHVNWYLPDVPQHLTVVTQVIVAVRESQRKQQRQTTMPGKWAMSDACRFDGMPYYICIYCT